MENVVTTAQQSARYRADGSWTDDTLSSRIAHHASSDPDRDAVIDELGQRRRSYRQLAHDAAVAAAMLSDHGVESGDVVSIQLPNRYETVVAAVAVQSLGAVINPLLPNYRERELTHVIRTARPRAIFTPTVYRGFDHRGLVEKVQVAIDQPCIHVVVGSEGGGDVDLGAVLQEGRDRVTPLATGAAASAVSELIFTSGTEATPKAIMHTEETANFAVRSTFSGLGIADDQVVWMPSPVGHSTGFNYGVRAALYHGQTIVLQDRWNAADALELIRAHRCSYTLAATTFLEDLVEECEGTGTSVDGFSHFGCGGAPVPPTLVERARDVGIQVLRIYGSTEVLCATWNRPSSPFVKRCTTDGYALEGTEVEVRDDAGHPLTPPAEGELHIRGANTSVGFFADPERTAATYLDGGWVRSGDLATIDADGYITIVGRKKEIIIRGGVNIAPREIEELLTAFPEVRQAAVVGLPDPRLGERGCACVVLEPGQSLDFDTMVARLREAGLATYKLPERLIVWDELPVTPSGKVQKHEIVRRVGGIGSEASTGKPA